jgi:hypothetical protein
VQRTPDILRTPTAGEERAARRSLRAQIAQLEARLSALTVDTYPHVTTGALAGRPSAPRLLSLGELERERDRLVARLAGGEREAAEQAARQARAQALLEAMLADPPAHRWRRVANADLGVPGCTVYQVRPRLGPLGLLLDWWQVKVSSGCPLAS